jgi:hypothetical protein
MGSDSDESDAWQPSSDGDDDELDFGGFGASLEQGFYCWSSIGSKLPVLHVRKDNCVLLVSVMVRHAACFPKAKRI